jgi:hypothetical protein
MFAGQKVSCKKEELQRPKKDATNAKEIGWRHD